MKFLFDFLPVLLFFVAYKVWDIYVATGVAIGTAALQLGYLKARGQKVERQQWLVMAALVVLGGLTFIFHNEAFIKWKPTVVYGAMALGFWLSPLIGGKPLVQRMLGHVLDAPDRFWARLNLIWGAFFLFAGGLNLAVAFTQSTEFWVNFKLFGLIGLTLVFVLAQAPFMLPYAKPDLVKLPGATSDDQPDDAPTDPGDSPGA